MSEIKEKINYIKDKIFEISKKEISIMEVCGTHTMSLARYAVRSMLPENINIISGPGCPVCVTAAGDIQMALDLTKRDDFIVATFGDMLKVPSKGETLENCPNVRVIYSPMDALTLAEENPEKNIVFLGIGFETTTPLIASTILSAKEKNLKNFTVLSMHKTVPIAMQAILGDKDNKINGLILPGHVSAITGRSYFDFIREFNVSGVVSGFEALDVMEAIYLLTKYANENSCEVTNNYTRYVKEEGNKNAMNILYQVFEDSDSNWRGIGVIPKSGLSIRDEYKEFDAKKRFCLLDVEIEDAPGCICGAILMGKKKPFNCGHFGKGCTPANPVGPCMVSSEGTCAAYYKYNV